MIGYPNRKVMPTPAVKAQDNHMGRGMSLENDLNDSQSKKDEARQKHINELFYYWYYYYQLRSLTLWDFNTNTNIDADFEKIIKQ